MNINLPSPKTDKEYDSIDFKSSEFKAAAIEICSSEGLRNQDKGYGKALVSAHMTVRG